MKNIHLMPTNKPSRLYIGDNANFVFGIMQNSVQSRNDNFTNRHIYITSDEEIKDGDWCICEYSNGDTSVNEFKDSGGINKYRVIITTDPQLIKDGIQAIDDQFLEWFVKNPSCESVEVQKWSSLAECGYSYHIIIPKEEPKQEISVTKKVIKCYCGHTTTCDCGDKEETLEEFNQIIMKTIAQQLNIKEFPFEIKDKNGNIIYVERRNGYWTKQEFDSNGNKTYFENSAGDWYKYEYDLNGNEIYLENSNGFWTKNEYDSNGNEIYWENSIGYWTKMEYDSNGKEIYYENSLGRIEDNRPKPSCEGKIVEIEGKKYKLTSL
jgi:hypothetical protein